MPLQLIPPEYTVDRPETLTDYRRRGGYSALERVLKSNDRDWLLDQVKRSGLSGRGGAGFSTAAKWSFMPQTGDDGGDNYLCVNADESEPGTFKDRHLMERVPHLLLEGILIAAWAMRAQRVFILLRYEYPASRRSLERAMAEARSEKLLGPHILGSTWSLDPVIRLGAGTYISGEEMALLETVEGHRAWPRQKPPFPAQRGVFRRPTTVNNVETLACVPLVVAAGAEAFAAMGTGKSTGPKLYCLSGHVNRPGLYEAPMTVTLKQLIYDSRYGGGIRGGAKLKAVIPGGSSSPVLRPDEIDIPAGFEALAKAGSMLGSAAIIVMDESVCMVRAAMNTAHFFDHETCGECTPCREGCHWMRQILDRIESGRGLEGDIELMRDRLAAMEGQTICPFGDAVTLGLGSIIEKFEDEFRNHIRTGRCDFAPWRLEETQSR